MQNEVQKGQLSLGTMWAFKKEQKLVKVQQMHFAFGLEIWRKKIEGAGFFVVYRPLDPPKSSIPCQNCSEICPLLLTNTFWSRSAEFWNSENIFNTKKNQQILFFLFFFSVAIVKPGKNWKNTRFFFCAQKVVKIVKIRSRDNVKIHRHKANSQKSWVLESSVNL